ncbi:hypothetical protein [Krasilnikoviella flava]|uniref:Uncharacterized protein n=1 Tax=Krasilnikoviella flava TaxID=526729 RepID=A0A1T5LJS8_9MICO|nr:hypothetical protein [Krasilnikoviella flava]SKC76231.1 hypothetical protein SAMN04324258_3558 [Krasilnikoviella flava]
MTTTYPAPPTEHDVDGPDVDEPAVDVDGAPFPPAHYPHRDWTDDTADPFHVPPELRDDYAAAIPPADLREAYWRSGAVREHTFGWAEMVAWAHDHGHITGSEAAQIRTGNYGAPLYRKVVSAADGSSSVGPTGGDEGDPLPRGLVAGPEWGRSFTVRERVTGPDGFAEWMHGERLELATRARRRRLADAEREAHRRAEVERWTREHTCPSCGQLDEIELLPVAAPGPVAARARLCTLCRAHAERILLDAETVDGRPRRELVTDHLRTLEGKSS